VRGMCEKCREAMEIYCKTKAAATHAKIIEVYM